MQDAVTKKPCSPALLAYIVTATRSGLLLSTPVDAKEASNNQYGNRRLDARQFMFNAHARSRVQLGRDSREQLSDAEASNICCGEIEHGAVDGLHHQKK